MTPEQRERLKAIGDRLIEQTIMDADPDNWSGAGQTLAAMDKDVRGDALWCRKIAVQTVMLMTKVEQLATDPAGALGKGHPKDDDMARAIVRAEAEAERLMERVQKKVRGAAGAG
jgi:hypothetical protein